MQDRVQQELRSGQGAGMVFALVPRDYKNNQTEQKKKSSSEICSWLLKFRENKFIKLLMNWNLTRSRQKLWKKCSGKPRKSWQGTWLSWMTTTRTCGSVCKKYRRCWDEPDKYHQRIWSAETQHCCSYESSCRNNRGGVMHNGKCTVLWCDLKAGYHRKHERYGDKNTPFVHPEATKTQIKEAVEKNVWRNKSKKA